MPSESSSAHAHVTVDSHAELPFDPDTPQPPHARPSAWALVIVGASVGAALRIWIEQTWPAQPGAWPWATFGINVAGSWLLGMILETLAILGTDRGWRQNIRMLAATGICSTFTTYSTLALEVALLGRDAHPVLATCYGIASVIVGFSAAWIGVGTAKRLMGIVRVKN